MSTCFSCGSRGHKANECPKRKPYKGKKPSERKGQVKRVVEADNKWKKELVVTGEFTVSRRRVLKGDVKGNECELLLDTGANLSAIVPRLVQKEHYTGSYVVLEDFRGESMMAPLAKVTVSVGDRKITQVFAVVEGLKDAVLLGKDIEVMDELLDKEMQLRKEEERKMV